LKRLAGRAVSFSPDFQVNVFCASRQLLELAEVILIDMLHLYRFRGDALQSQTLMLV
jgi:hypothetical protein